MTAESQNNNDLADLNSLEAQKRGLAGESLTGASVGEAVELQPWLIVMEDGGPTALAMWQIAGREQPSLAMFAERDDAELYARTNLDGPYKLLRLDRNALLRVMTDCFRQGVEFAALNPDHETANRLFVLRDVLKAARAELRRQR